MVANVCFIGTFSFDFLRNFLPLLELKYQSAATLAKNVVPRVMVNREERRQKEVFEASILRELCLQIHHAVSHFSYVPAASSSLTDVAIGEEVDAKCQHVREIVCPWLPFDR